MPAATLRAFADHGDATRALGESTGAAEEILRDAEDAGIDLAAITGQLEREGVRRRSARPTGICSPASKASSAKRARPP